MFCHTVLSRAKHSAMAALLGLGGGRGGRFWLAEDELEVVEEADEELTKLAVSDDCGLGRVPLTGLEPEVKPSSAELECRPFNSGW